ncbi:MAG: sulfatase-like hydrolase/transferase, partial [Spirochaetes bacterium]|nr:sulfatase-like hydrolase/transferase [Spirochaetota bacterium]
MLFCVFWSFFFFPDDYAITQREARIASPLISEKIDVDLLQRIPQMRVFGNASSLVIEGLLNKIKQQRVLIKQEAYTYGKNAHLHVRIGTGHQGIWVDERSAILLPMGTSVYFDIEIKKGARAEFAGLSTLASGNLAVVLKSGKKFTVIEELYLDEYKQKFTAQDAVLRFINRKYPRATDDIGWKIFTIHLSKYEGRRIQLGFMNKGNSAIAIANPRIFIPAKQRRYNVIYIVFDGVSTRLWSMYNENSSLTPFMKQKAEEEFIVFDNMFALGDKTRISTVGLFCSIFPFLSRHGINRNYIPDNEIEHFYAAVRLGQFMPLPEFFRRNGYISRQFGNSGFTVQLLGTGVDYGFDASYEFSFNPYDTYGITTRFFNFLRENAGREFFVYLHYNTPHKPFYAPLRYYFKGVLNAPLASLWRPDFMGCIQYTDDVFKNLYEAFKTHGLLENSMIVVATDHGSGFDLSKFDAGFQYADYTRMMFMIYIPPRLRRELGITQKRVSPYISQLNIAPTLVE